MNGLPGLDHALSHISSGFAFVWVMGRIIQPTKGLDSKHKRRAGTSLLFTVPLTVFPTDAFFSCNQAPAQKLDFTLSSPCL